MAGAPLGNQNGAKGKLWAAAIQRALDIRTSRLDRKQAVDDLAEKLLAKCDEGDMAALKELGDRLDGRPAQALQLTGDKEAPVCINVTAQDDRL